MKLLIQRFSFVLVVACLTLLVTTVVAEEGLVNHWEFDGDYKDSVGKDHAWALYTDIKGPPTWETGRIGQAVTGWWRPFKCPTHTTPRTEDFRGWSAWIEGKWKLHHFKKKYELYDLDADPAETKDLAEQNPEVVQELTKKLRQWQRSVEVSLTGADNETEPTIKMR